LGPKIQGGVESSEPELYPFILDPDYVRDPICDNMELVSAWYTLEDFFGLEEIEGIVWHHQDGRMAKIKRRDFGYPWPPER
jgi:hypothetical protein